MNSPPAAFYIGWDVGGWNCDRNRNSRDSIVILDSALSIQGKPWRGNLRMAINESEDRGETSLKGIQSESPAVRRVREAVTLGTEFPKNECTLKVCHRRTSTIDYNAPMSRSLAQIRVHLILSAKDRYSFKANSEERTALLLPQCIPPVGS